MSVDTTDIPAASIIECANLLMAVCGERGYDADTACAGASLTAIWLHKGPTTTVEDLELVRELSAWLAAQSTDGTVN